MMVIKNIEQIISDTLGLCCELADELQRSEEVNEVVTGKLAQLLNLILLLEEQIDVKTALLLAPTRRELISSQITRDWKRMAKALDEILAPLLQNLQRQHS